MEVSATDLKRIRLYLEGAARLYDTQPGRRSACRAWVIRRMIRKIDSKFERQSKVKEDENIKGHSRPRGG